MIDHIHLAYDQNELHAKSLPALAKVKQLCLLAILCFDCTNLNIPVF